MQRQNIKNVELTKVHYYESIKRSRNIEVPTISREIFENSFNKNSIIRKNIFGQRWVLKINETKDLKKRRERWKIFLYVLVFCCILVSVLFGIYLYFFESLLFLRYDNSTKQIIKQVPKKTIKRIFVTDDNVSVERVLKKIKQEQLKVKEKSFNAKNITNNEVLKQSSDNNTKKIKTSFCNCKNPGEVCLKTRLLEPPVCVLGKDPNDPSGCGGICAINTQFCKILDKNRAVYECIDNTNNLKCPKGYYNCGELCIPANKQCDGVMDCKNNLDEKNCACDLTTNFQCGNHTSCLENSKKCDGRVDCWDKSDEEGCREECELNKVPCGNGSQCIYKEQICDGNQDCTDGSDELPECRVSTKMVL